jgi:hypothetical protein
MLWAGCICICITRDGGFLLCIAGNLLWFGVLGISLEEGVRLS